MDVRPPVDDPITASPESKLNMPSSIQTLTNYYIPVLLIQIYLQNVNLTL